ncbi:hypothetical protein [Microcoleus sp. Pol17_C1]|jgi:chromosome segregation ATPase|uniref:hypothetical protein n=1 Tax=unclassified Microcoleus TaxID=2642155 RepID=UPI002FD61A7A
MPNPKGHEDSIKHSRFKAAWQSGPTRTIRVPIALADATLDYARQLDQNTEPRDTALKANNQLSNSVDVGGTEPHDTATIRAELEAELAELAQLKKEVKEVAAELHREENCMKLEKIRWQRELSDARGELADAKATMLKQADRIRELERGYSFKPNPAESRLRLEIGELQEQLADLKQNLAAASQDLPEAADLLNQLKAKRKKSAVTLADVEFLLELLEG